MTLSIADIISENNIALAIDNLASKKNSCGIDGIYTSDIREYWLRNKEKIINTISMRKYEVGAVRQTEILISKKLNTFKSEIQRVICPDEDQVAIYEFDTLRYTQKEIIGYHLSSTNIL